jgi:hypothetical protein
MKIIMKHIKLGLLFTLTMVLWSCNDAIDIEQPGRLGADQAFSTTADLEQGIFGVYAFIDTSSEIQFNSVFTDEISIGFDNGGQGLGNGEYGFILNPGSAAPAAIWLGNYSVLNAANRLITAAEGITPEAEEQENYNNVVGEALAIRAFAHFQLLSYFSSDYSDDAALAAILVDFVPTVDQQLERSTNADFYALIESDLSRAATLLQVESSATFVSKDFVTALRARVAAYRGDYSSAGTLSQSLLDKYPLANRAEYEAMFLDTDNTGIIFKLERTIGDGYDGQGATGSGFAGGWAGANYAFVDGTIDGSPYFEMGRSLFNQLDTDDVRYDVNVNNTSIISDDYQNAADFKNEDILVIGKYPGNEKPLLNDLKVFRVAEMLLIRAEAYADAGTLNGATNSTAALIKQLRDARFGTDTPLPNFASQQEAFGAILDERRIEFAFEGHRWKDLKRMGERAGRSIDRDPLDCAVNGACNLPVTDFRFTMPIPLVELNANSNITQNSGY